MRDLETLDDVRFAVAMLPEALGLQAILTAVLLSLLNRGSQLLEVS